jgi:hypothetical protein
VPSGVAAVFNREEARPTRRLSEEHVSDLREASSPWPSEPITRPAVLKKAEKIRTLTVWVMAISAAVFLGLMLGIFGHC